MGRCNSGQRERAEMCDPCHGKTARCVTDPLISAAHDESERTMAIKSNELSFSQLDRLSGGLSAAILQEMTVNNRHAAADATPHHGASNRLALMRGVIGRFVGLAGGFRFH